MNRASLLGVFLVIGLLLVAVASGESNVLNAEPLVIVEPGKVLELTYSDPVTIEGATLVVASTGEILHTYGADRFTGATTSYRFTPELADLSAGATAYQLIIQKQSPLVPGVALAEDVINFEYLPHNTLIDVSLRSPNPLYDLETHRDTHGYAAVSTEGTSYTVMFTTTKAGYCQYNTNMANPTADHLFTDMTPAQSTTASIQHTFTLNTPRQPINVRCREAGKEWEVMKRFELGSYAAAPDFTVEAEPATIASRTMDGFPGTTLTVTPMNGQEMFCQVTGGPFTTPFDMHSELGEDPENIYQAYNLTPTFNVTFNPATTPVHYDLTVACRNYAQQTTTQALSIDIDLSSTPVIQRVTPETYTPGNNPVVEVRAVRGTGEVLLRDCIISDGTEEIAMASPDGNTVEEQGALLWSTSYTGLEEGLHTFSVACRDVSWQPISGSISFTVDSQAPHSNRAFPLNHDRCVGELFAGSMSVSHDHEEDANLAGYHYDITRGADIFLVEDASTEGGISLDLSNIALYPDFLPETQYDLSIAAYDHAGNEQTSPTRNWTYYHPAGDLKCDHEPPRVGDSQTILPAMINETITCNDDLSGCTDSFTYSKQAIGDGTSDCSYELVGEMTLAAAGSNGASPSGESTAIPFYTDQELCVNVTDANGNSKLELFTITLSEYLPTVLINSPTRYWDNRKVDFDVAVGVDTQHVPSETCTITPTQTFPPGGEELPLTSTDEVDWKGTVSVSEDGDYIAEVSCITKDGDEISQQQPLTIDSQAPSGYEVIALSQPTCSDQHLQVDVHPKAHTPHDTNFLHYRYELKYGIGTDIIEAGTTTSNILTYQGSLDPDEQYIWKITVVDKAGHETSLQPLTIDVVPPSSTECDYTPPTGTATTRSLYGGIQINVSCSDDLACAESFRWDRLGVSQSASACDFTRQPSYTYTDPELEAELLFYEPLRFCYQVFDTAGNQHNGSILITDITTGNNSGNGNTTPLHCTNGKLNLDKGETDIDCGGDCPECDTGSYCTFDSDCTTGICDALSGACKEDTCINGVTDGFESDVDCGGICTGCDTGASCSHNEDCSSGYCADGSCEDVSCSDGLLNGYETDIDCGGARCASCDVGETCEANADCNSGYCENSQCVTGPTSDSDGDDIPDDWELRYGLDPFDPSDAAADPDEDGLSNYEEFLIGTDPFTPDSQQGGSDGFSIWGLLLIVLGVVLIGGSGYWLYYEHEQKTPGHETPQAFTPPQQELHPLQRMGLAQRGTASQPTIPPPVTSDAKTAPATPKKTRTRLSTSFSENTAQTSTETTQEEQTTQTQEYLTIDEMKDKAVEKAAENAAQKPKKKNSFSDLDKLIKK
jgi:hypothetical protein